MKKYLFITIVTLIVFAACNQPPKKSETTEKDTTVQNLDSAEIIEDSLEFEQAKKLQQKVELAVTADVETEVMPVPNEDIADDPAIWINPADAAKSSIIGTNKVDGLHVYDLNGKELFYYQIGRTNNVDVRYGFPLGKEKVDLVACSNRKFNGISLFKVNPKDGSLENIEARRFKIDTTKMDDVYGFCMYKSPTTSKYYAIINAKNGLVQQYELIATDDKKIDLKLVREMHLQSQPEGMVADDEKGILYVGEERKGVWKYDAEPDADTTATLIFNADSLDVAVPDIEGISLYYAPKGKGYLIISSQGNFTYIILDRETHEYIASFKVVENGMDGIEETDGVDVINLPLGDKFPKGVFVAQDGFNYENGKKAPQNFKLVAWEKIAKLTNPPLIINPEYEFRK